ncbi:MAG: hypothetical protein ACTHQE_17725 [Thermomicrobiales bacterium]
MDVTLTPYWTRYLEEMVEFEGFKNPEEALRHVLRTYQQQKFVRELREEARRTEDPAYVASLPEWTEHSVEDLVTKILSGETRSKPGPTPWHLLPPESLEFEISLFEEPERQIAENPAPYRTGSGQGG